MIKYSLMLLIVLYSSMSTGMEKNDLVAAAATSSSSKPELVKTVVKLLPFSCTIMQGNLREKCGIKYATQGQLNRHLKECHGITIAKKRRNGPRECPGI